MEFELNCTPLSTWLPHKDVAIIAGPCSAETEEQLIATCLQLKNLNISALRAGIWKPRTRPGNFEGHGEIALPWIQTVKKEVNLPFAIEVATPQHIELALKYGVDILWIGARTTVNPFNVQDLADALRGVDIPVMIKNPVNPDLALWLGAIERIHKVGINKIAAIHRGFSSLQESKYRNPPTWQIPLELKRIFPQLPIICDPSHITGVRNLVAQVSQKALDLNYEGLMIETHITPDKAWSDAKQQVNPEELGEMIAGFQIRKQKTDDVEFNNHLEQLRKQIDEIDRELIEVFATRMKLVEQIGDYKKDNNISIFQLDRWNEIFRTRPIWAEKMGLSKDLIQEIYKLIHVESIRKQTEVMTKSTEKV
ncbi:MAG: bifunctional 3-deoxy-7-phosphoheptulonate synthase/chorismate mutase type II [Raineya sp.]|jgi:chorismate mutase|nr:bifunctional 3-deoxy-7-phosphoheptulonate synthase/chorismate mutase type II [Raineya sp.]